MLRAPSLTTCKQTNPYIPVPRPTTHITPSIFVGRQFEQILEGKGLAAWRHARIEYHVAAHAAIFDMAASGADGSGGASGEPRGIDLMTLPVQQLAAIKEQLEGQIEQFSAHFNDLQVAITGFHASGLAVEGLANEKDGMAEPLRTRVRPLRRPMGAKEDAPEIAHTLSSDRHTFSSWRARRQRLQARTSSCRSRPRFTCPASFPRPTR